MDRELELIVQRLVQIGFVTDTDDAKKMARVKFPNADETSGWLPVLQHVGAALTVKNAGKHTHSIQDTYTGGGSASEAGEHTHGDSTLGAWMPKVNDTVVVLYLPILDADGFVLGGISA
ncbi:MAG: hypothetical protein IJT18_04075 [Oscillospiraceae bacterium]|nr:hypothetical protein [Oscillospiraceae bacterium]